MIEILLAQPQEILNDKSILPSLGKLIKEDDIKMVRFILENVGERFINVNTIDEDGKTLVNEAVSKNMANILKDYKKEPKQNDSPDLENETEDFENREIKMEPSIKEEKDSIEVDENFQMTFEDMKPVVKLGRIENFMQFVKRSARKRKRSAK